MQSSALASSGRFPWRKALTRSRPTSPATAARRPPSAPANCAHRGNSPSRALSTSTAITCIGWADVTATQVYTIFDLHSFLGDEFVRRGAMAGGLTWHFARPPVQGLDFEVDVRGVGRELIISQ